MALAEAHERGIVHRDVSSCNVMLTATGVKVLDFGIAALIGGARLAEPDKLLGTPAYVAPERLRDNDVTAAVDVYAVGILLYRMLRGILPVAGGDSDRFARSPSQAQARPSAALPGLPRRASWSCAIAVWPRIPPIALQAASWRRGWPRWLRPAQAEDPSAEARESAKPPRCARPYCRGIPAPMTPSAGPMNTPAQGRWMSLIGEPLVQRGSGQRREVAVAGSCYDSHDAHWARGRLTSAHAPVGQPLGSA